MLYTPSGDIGWVMTGHQWKVTFFNKKVKNVSCEYDRLNGWNSTLQAAVRWQGGDTEYPLAGLPISLVLGGYSLLISEDVVEKQLYYSQSGVVMASDDAVLARLFLW